MLIDDTKADGSLLEMFGRRASVNKSVTSGTTPAAWDCTDALPFAASARRRFVLLSLLVRRATRAFNFKGALTQHSP
jgi:hypothetical protein